MSKKISMPKAVKLIPIGQLKPYEKNARTHSDSQIKKIVASMEEFGFTNPVLVDGENNVIAGHGRIQAAEKLGLRKVPVVYLDHLTPDQTRAYILADNRLAEDADWDESLLAEELRALDESGFNLELTGFEEAEIQELLMEEVDQVVETGETPSISDTPVVSLGELWELGEHWLFIGDATEEESYRRLLGDLKADLVFTDPPYGAAYTSDKDDSILGDLSQATIPISFKCMIELATKADSRIYLCGSSKNSGMYQKLFESYCRQQVKFIIWVKEHFVQRQNNYHSQFEVIYFGWKGKGGGPKHWYGDRAQTDVWQVSRDTVATYSHPTQKPVEIPEKAISNS
ncbi:MAG: ParB N-terminal domain-containing protein, partial [Bdellovibrionales bacterium]|nr:ParB N-terminal domain-containing protein [Bdellovibrionales bacterium]